MKIHSLTIKILVILLLLSTVWMFLIKYLETASPNMEEYLFVPVYVDEVAADQDIVVSVTPIGPQGKNSETVTELNLNEIDKGWVTHLYGGKCRIIFDINDSSIGDQISSDSYVAYQFYYADLVPRDRLTKEDRFDLMIGNLTDPFASGKEPTFYFDSVQGGIYNYYWMKDRHYTRNWIIRNVVLIGAAIAIDTCITRCRKARKE